MKKLGQLIVGIVLLQAGCDDDDNGGVVPPIDEGTAFSVALSPSAEVPACAAAGFYATGAARIVISSDGSTVMVENLTFSDLSGPATAAHIHAGVPGVAGPIVLDMGTTNLTPPINRMFTEANYPAPPPAGAPADFATFTRQMESGATYVNVHTAACPTGEVRGQLQ